MIWLNQLGFWIGLSIKLLGYTLFLKLWFRERITRTIAVAAFRSALGVAEMIFLLSMHVEHYPTHWFYLGLIVSRILIWGLTGMIFYRSSTQGKLARFIFVSTLVSCLLDIPTLFGWIAFEGWIC